MLRLLCGSFGKIEHFASRIKVVEVGLGVECDVVSCDRSVKFCDSVASE